MARPPLDPATAAQVAELRAQIRSRMAARGIRKTDLVCLTAVGATAVAEEIGDNGGPDNTVSVHGNVVHITYFDARYPMNLAEWAADNGHASDEAAARVIASL
jgi:hypothetical protein